MILWVLESYGKSQVISMYLELTIIFYLDAKDYEN